MIELSHVYKTFPGPVHALRNIDLRIGKGEFVFLTGPSGAGKSTLFKMICAYDKVSSGRIEVCQRNLGSLRATEVPFFRRQIGVVFQDFKLLKDLSVAENVALPLWVRGEKESLIRRRVGDLLESVGLSHKAETLPELLSGGEQQRVAIARAVIHQPGLLIADEPTGNLDPALSEEIMDLFEKVSAQGTTVFIATHDHEMVKRRRKRTLLIQEGLLSEANL